MRKYFVILLLVLSCTSLRALPLGNPWEASLLDQGIFFCHDPDCGGWLSCFKLRAGLWEEFVNNRKLRVNDSTSDAVLHQTSIRTDAAYIALNFCNRWDLFTTLGNSRIDIVTPRSAWLHNQDAGNQLTFLWQHPNFSWSVGARGTLWQCGCLAVGAETQYFYTKPSIESFRADGIVVDRIDSHLKYQDWQFGLGAAYKVVIGSTNSAIVPYTGLTFSQAWSTTHNFIGAPTAFNGQMRFFDLKQQFVVGYGVGMTFVWSRRGSVTVEARFRDERAYSLNAQVAF